LLPATCFLLLALLALRGEPDAPTPNVAGHSLTLILVGDVMLGRGVAQALEGEWAAATVAVRPWLVGDDADRPKPPRLGFDRGPRPPDPDRVLSFANLESPLTTAPQVREGHDLRAPPGAVAALRAAGFDVVSLANNHALDAGEAGLRETVRTLRGAGIGVWMDRPRGLGRHKVAQPVEGLAFDDSVAPLEVEDVVQAVSAAAERAEAVIVSIHWGGEYQAAPSARQQALAEALAEAGADVIVGHGPHVLQRVAWVGETLVAYSLGNFLFDQPYPFECRWGAILNVTLRDGRAIGVEAYPTVTERGRVQPADPEAGAAICDRLGLGCCPTDG
jgi:poly-gamma-glutamate synthesis protein (capsule biosynthesis protein)